jgi:hypothetical protein
LAFGPGFGALAALLSGLADMILAMSSVRST